jgi:hypothetical protein
MLPSTFTRDGNQATAPRTVTGRYLAHAKLSAAERAFIGADLVTERIKLVRPTLVSAASLARSNCAYVSAALKRQDERALIEAGVRPLALPPQPILPAHKSAQEKLADIVREVGSGMVLDLLAGIEADHIDAAIGGGNGAATNGATPH